ncbi:MAG: hypothetical protein ACRBFS_06615 [Aureispira sp.]
MKRLSLDAFKSKKMKKDNPSQIQQLLGQMFGNGSDDPKYDSGGTTGGWMDDMWG